MIKTSVAAILAGACLAVAGVAVAQTGNTTNSTITSTPGAGCTATGNAMRAGNLGGTATPNVCNDAPGAKAAAATTTTTTTGSTAAAPAPAPSTLSSGSTGSGSSAMAADTTTPPSRAATRVARADRG